ncbi:MAG: ParB/RepB/Spo0J family partition protein, partial [Lachnospiraceae bacterium]|nr:ParB/RepB/Spo0J family partition protein [Lachnospiraceae bacterium]
MPKQGANLNLKSYDDIFSTAEERAEKEATVEHVQQLDISKLVPFSGHPFKVRDDEEMEKTVDSIRQFGVLNPVIVRPMDNGLFEIVSGHRRCHASALAGLESVPGIVRNLDDDEATILMVDSNLQRETILPSERAWAFRMKIEALRHQGEKRATSRQLGEKSWAVTELSTQSN